jgi:UDP-glucose 4-epimerase
VKVLVTGGAGFIGSHVVDRLLAAGHEPTIFDLASPIYNQGSVEYVSGDVLDAAAFARALRRCDAVIHLAAVADVNAVLADPSHAGNVNVLGTQIALECARDAGIGRFLFGSTIWAYGNGPAASAITEDSALKLPEHPYTATKLAAEMLCFSYGELYGLDTVNLRFGIPHGPRSRAAAVVAMFVARARTGKALTITGDGTQRRQFVYVEDLAAGVVAALVPSLSHRVYNLVGNESVSVLEIAKTVRDLVCEVPIVHTRARPADLEIGHVSGERAARELRWRTTTPFREGVLRYLDWLTETSGAPTRAAASMIDGSAEAVLRQEAGEL